MAYSEESTVSFTAPFYVGCLFPHDDDQKELEDKQRIAQAHFHTAATTATSNQPTHATHTNPTTPTTPTTTASPANADYHTALVYETIQYQFLDTTLLIRQFDDHPTNANALWPEATFLAEFLTATNTFAPPAPHPAPHPAQPASQPGQPSHLHTLLPPTTRILELGSATGALSIYLRLHGLSNLTTSDVCDPLVTDNIAYNCTLNGVQHKHVEHRWGDVDGLVGLMEARRRAAGGVGWGGWDVVLGSDLLAYESSYEGLSETVSVLLPAGEEGLGKLMWMCWKRREQKGKDRENGWFGIMRRKGFECTQMGKGIWRIQRQRQQTAEPTVREVEVIQ